MKSFPILRLEGPPGEIGFRHGREAGDLIDRCINYYRARFEREAGIAWDKALDIARQIDRQLQPYAPAMVEEIDGIARGAEQPREALIAVNARTELFYTARRKPPQVEECTAAAVTGKATADGNTYVVQNWDQDMEIREHVVVVEAHMPGQPAILYLTEAGILARSGLNEHGIGITGNALNSTLELESGFGVPLSVIRREAMLATSWEKAVDAVFRATRSHSANHVLGSRDGRIVDLETAPGAVFTVEPEEGILAHSNHFVALDPQAAAVGRIIDVSGHSHKRFSRMRSTLEAERGHIDVNTLKGALRDHTDRPCAICRHDGQDSAVGHGSISSIIMDLAALRLLVAPGPPCEHDYTEYRFS